MVVKKIVCAKRKCTTPLDTVEALGTQAKQEMQLIQKIGKTTKVKEPL